MSTDNWFFKMSGQKNKMHYLNLKIRIIKSEFHFDYSKNYYSSGTSEGTWRSESDRLLIREK